MKKLVMIGIHKESKNYNNKTIPASIIKIYETKEEVDCFGREYIGCAEQVYARPNKKIDYNTISENDFKGKKGIAEEFYSESFKDDFLKMIIEDGYELMNV